MNLPATFFFVVDVGILKLYEKLPNMMQLRSWKWQTWKPDQVFTDIWKIFRHILQSRDMKLV